MQTNEAMNKLVEKIEQIVKALEVLFQSQNLEMNAHIVAALLNVDAQHMMELAI
ncbi:hypothetical protein ACOI1C_06090 [Bacillus sp. DJP31]|uniref:hypothetical protein n=1 Tax=Bacillus sp. DJP31 TaxID=3409789 RepID=UPI003BB51F01